MLANEAEEENGENAFLHLAPKFKSLRSNAQGGEEEKSAELASCENEERSSNTSLVFSEMSVRKTKVVKLSESVHGRSESYDCERSIGKKSGIPFHQFAESDLSIDKSKI